MLINSLDSVETRTNCFSFGTRQFIRVSTTLIFNKILCIEKIDRTVDEIVSIHTILLKIRVVEMRMICLDSEQSSRTKNNLYAPRQP
jgi:hypothetical protein